jgi:hypothetical protein
MAISATVFGLSDRVLEISLNFPVNLLILESMTTNRAKIGIET